MPLNPNSDLAAAVTATRQDDQALAQGVIAETYDALLCSNAGTAYSVGVLHLTKLVIPAATTISSVLFTVGTAGAALTAGQNLLGLYSTAGVLLGQTADQSAAFGTATGTAVGKTAALTAPVAVAAGSYLVGVLTNGTTGVALGRTANAGPYGYFTTATGGGHRYASTGSGLTALPASFVPSGVVVENVPVWVGVN